MHEGHSLLQQVQQCIHREGLCPEGAHVAVALSGGADSVALLRAMCRLGYRVEALHCHFHLRGDESDGDEAFVRALCDAMEVACTVRHFDTRAFARAEGLSIEMAARALRYEWFAEWLAAHPGGYVALAHNAQDSVETLLLNLSSGTSLRGLRGVPYQRNAGRIIRPLLDTMPSTIHDYLNALGQSWRTDSSNADETYQRNYVRHRLLPAFEALRPAFVATTLRTIEHLRGVECYYLESIARHRDRVMQGHVIDIEQLMASPEPQTLLFEILRTYGFSGDSCRELYASLGRLAEGSAFYSSTHWVSYSWGKLYITERSEAMTEPFAVRFTPSHGLRVGLPSGHIELSLHPRAAITELRTPPEVMLLDWHALGGQDGAPELSIRPPEVGERFQPFGLAGSKLISRLLLERRVPRHRRSEALLLCCGARPLWLIGLVPSRHYCVTERTTQVLCLKFTPHGQ